MSNSFENVLIVDDSFVNIEFLEMFFMKHQANVTKATHASEALECLKNGSYDISLIDYHMPDMDGLEMLRHLKSEGSSSKLGKVYILTADVAFNPGKLGALDLIDGYMIKPVDIDKLEALLMS